MKSKRLVFAFLALVLIFTAQGLFAQNYPEMKNYFRETQTMQFRPHGGDRGEIADFFDFFLKNYRNIDAVVPLLAMNSMAAVDVDQYYRKILAYQSLDPVFVSLDKLYTIQEGDAFNNFRAIVGFKYIAKDSLGRLIEFTDHLGLAKLGSKPNDWKIWGIVWKDSGIDVSPANLVQLEMPKPGEEICVMTTDAGVIKMRLFPDHAPKTVHNFKVVAKLGFYDNLPFLRVYDNFMIQGGALDETPEYELSSFGMMFEDEFHRDLYNFRGALCMGNAGPNTNGNQIYIVQDPTCNPEYINLGTLPLNVEEKYKQIGGRAYLDRRYTVFGHVFEGIEIVDTIARQAADDNGRPTGTPIKILSVRFQNY